MVATDVFALLHVPPVAASESVSAAPAQTPVVPAIAPGAGIIVTVVVTLPPEVA